MTATGRFGLDTLRGFQILIPTMSSITRELLAEADELRLIQQCGVGLEGVDLEAARDLEYPGGQCTVGSCRAMPIPWPNWAFIS